MARTLFAADWRCKNNLVAILMNLASSTRKLARKQELPVYEAYYDRLDQIDAFELRIDLARLHNRIEIMALAELLRH